MKSIQELLKLSTSYLQERKIDRARRSAEDLLASVLGVKRIDLYLQFDRPLEEEGELSIFREKLKRLAKGEPLEYVMGEVLFLGAKIKVDSRVLIPRPETEILADWIVKRIKGATLLDLCTGSGALGISLKKALPHLEVIVSDISSEALSLATINAQENGIGVELLLGDLLAPLQGRVVDAVVCNPPYISEDEYLEISPSVSGYEPRCALVGGVKGVEFYERLARELPPHLTRGGQLFLEIGASQGDAVQKIFNTPEWGKWELLKDWSGKERFFFLEKQ